MNKVLRIISLNVARLLFVGGLLLALYLGLRWALAIEDRPDAESIAAAEAAREAATASPEPSDDEATAPTTATATATPVPVPTTEPPEVLIARAAPPPETTVQVLDAGGGSAMVDAAITALESIGYQIVARSPSSREVTATTIYYTEGHQAEAEGLRARDPRFRLVEANQGLSEGVDLHVLVGRQF